jgi:hypothetical protein
VWWVGRSCERDLDVFVLERTLALLGNALAATAVRAPVSVKLPAISHRLTRRSLRRELSRVCGLWRRMSMSVVMIGQPRAKLWNDEDRHYDTQRQRAGECKRTAGAAVRVVLT